MRTLDHLFSFNTLDFHHENLEIKHCKVKTIDHQCAGSLITKPVGTDNLVDAVVPLLSFR